MHRTLFATAFLLALFGGLTLFFAHSNHARWQERQAQIPRMEKVRARVQDKGISTTTRVVRTTRSAGRDSRAENVTDSSKWIHFTCLVAGKQVDGARLNLSGSDAEWERFSKGQDSPAFWDPVAEECVLRVDETVGSDREGRRMAGLGAAELLAAALAAGLGSALVRRRPRGLV